MAYSRLQTAVCTWTILGFLFGCWVSAPFSLAVESIAPERKIAVVQADPAVPEWKTLWDRARDLVRDGQFSVAAEVYAELHRAKPNVEEAGWEYCKVLLKIGNYSTVAKIIDGLLEKNQNRQEYLLVAGQVAEQAKDFTKAAFYFGKAFEQDPAGDGSDAALEGLVKSLRSQGRKDLAFSLNEQLSVRRPDDFRILHEVAIDARDLGKISKAQSLFERLMDYPESEIDDRIIFQAAELFDAPGYERRCNELRLEYLNRHPDYLPFRLQLVDYYENNNNFEKALQHLSYLIEKTEDNSTYLLQAGELCLHELHRPDKALVFFEQYMARKPDDHRVGQKIKNIQSILANDFLSIVENDGAWLLWRDLAKIAPNRLAIYLEMADLLEKRKKQKELIEILSIIYDHSPDKKMITYRLAHQCFLASQPEKALGYLKALKTSDRTLESYLLQATIEGAMGKEMSALDSKVRALSYAPADESLRIDCINLSGRIGNVDQARELFEDGLRQNDNMGAADLVFSYLDQLTANYLFTEYLEVYNRVQSWFRKDDAVTTRLALHRSQQLRKEGKNRQAEQLLRMLLNKDILVDEVLSHLVDNAAEDRNHEVAMKWYDALAEHLGKKSESFSVDEMSLRLLIHRIKIELSGGQYDAAARRIKEVLPTLESSPTASSLTHFAESLNRELCWTEYYRGEHQKSFDCSRKISRLYGFQPDNNLLQRISGERLKAKEMVGAAEKELFQGTQPILSRFIALGAVETKNQHYTYAKEHLQKALEIYPQSIVANVQFSMMLAQKGEADTAIRTLDILMQRYPHESFWVRKLVELEVRKGKHQAGITLLHKLVGVTSVAELIDKLSTEEDKEVLLTYARLLWGAKRQKEALRVYKALLDPPISLLLSDDFNRKKINYSSLTRDDSFWSSMMVMLQSEPDLLADLMDPQFLLDNRGTEAGKIVARYYALHSLQKFVTNEYLARKAIVDRKYYYAEQSYKKLLAQDDTTETLLDLASIYGRIGKYRKEAQVYETIHNSGVESSNLKSSIERSSIQLSPRNTLDFERDEKDGRDGFMDMVTMSLGTSFWVTPDLEKDIRFSYSNNRYESVDGSNSVRSSFFQGGMNIDIWSDYELFFSTGVEKINGLSDARFIYEIGVKGQLEEYIDAYAHFGKGLVYDTFPAFLEEIAYNEIGTGLNIETPLGIGFGAGLRHRDYSDDNAQNRFQAYSSYTVFGKVVEVEMRYDYQYLTNDSESITDGDIAHEKSTPLYWSPESFYEHRMSLGLKHNFLGYEADNKRGMSYYLIKSGVGFEDNDVITYNGIFDIFLEMSPHFLLKGNFTFSTSDQYEEKGLSISLHYRW